MLLISGRPLEDGLGGLVRLAVLQFERAATKGFRLNIAAGTAVRFEPGQQREVELVEYAGDRKVFGFDGQVMGGLE